MNFSYSFLKEIEIGWDEESSPFYFGHFKLDINIEEISKIVSFTDPWSYIEEEGMIKVKKYFKIWAVADPDSFLSLVNIYEVEGTRVDTYDNIGVKFYPIPLPSFTPPPWSGWKIGQMGPGGTDVCVMVEGWHYLKERTRKTTEVKLHGDVVFLKKEIVDTSTKTQTQRITCKHHRFYHQGETFNYNSKSSNSIGFQVLPYSSVMYSNGIAQVSYNRDDAFMFNKIKWVGYTLSFTAPTSRKKELKELEEREEEEEGELEEGDAIDGEAQIQLRETSDPGDLDIGLIQGSAGVIIRGENLILTGSEGGESL